MEKQKLYEVKCNPHGRLAIISQAVLGIAIFDAHRHTVDGCREVSVKPVLREKMSDIELEEFNSGVNLTLTLNQMEMVKRRNEKIRRNNGTPTIYRQP